MSVFALIFSTGFILGFSGAMIPGPLTFYTISQVIKTNKNAGFGIIFGHILLELLLVCLILNGFKMFLANQLFLNLISLIGGISLIVMGLILLTRSRAMKLSIVSGTKEFSNKGLVVGGIFFSLISPGFIVWWTTIGLSSALGALAYGLLGLVVIMLGHWSADIIWYGLLSIMVEKGRKILSDEIYRRLIRFFSFSLILLGVVFIIAT
jgi:threonine/homoserine/homoserine lactone efflux protein